MFSLGICIGSTSIQCVLLNKNTNDIKIEYKEIIEHNGNPSKYLKEIFTREYIKKVNKLVITGRQFRTTLNAQIISEAEAIEYALSNKNLNLEKITNIVSLGGENIFVYGLSKTKKIVEVKTGNKCASGTGEFFLQQLRRMNITVNDLSKMPESKKVYKVAGRCSVFCKSDCTHAINKGEPVENIVFGLCNMMADNITKLLPADKNKKILLIGGCTKNKRLVDILSEMYDVTVLDDISRVLEAYGAAVYGFDNNVIVITEKEINNIFKEKSSEFSFSTFEQLNKYNDLVKYTKPYRDILKANDKCVLGIDVGSTTTKAVLIRSNDQKILASAYLRTNGNPIRAAKQCYEKIRNICEDIKFEIIEIGVTGSGRQIVGLHAKTSNIINEIIAHATAATFYDKDVDTIFEIGGQDAKYTYLKEGIPLDYAMNEACSAGTGSFLEESAIELLEVKMEEIADLAISSDHPLNFSDQCSAFISSDINVAIQEGANKNDILAGLVYSICMNYLNRVKGTRTIGKKIFFQGGVCYNKAVPLAMASLVKSEIIVPADTGLMGAFGVALEVVKRLKIEVIKESNFILIDLINREFKSLDSFVCAGGKSKCDRKCKIARIEIGKSVYPFGGACDLYYNMNKGKKDSCDYSSNDYVWLREHLLFEKYGSLKSMQMQEKNKMKTIGISRSFLTHKLYPLFSNFFANLGFEIVLSDLKSYTGKIPTEAPFCFPAEIAHGNFLNLLNKKLDYIFLPHILKMPTTNLEKNGHNKACVIVQAEPYYLKTTFQNEILETKVKLVIPKLNMQDSYEQVFKEIKRSCLECGISIKDIKIAWKNACKKQYEFEDELTKKGKEFLDKLDKNENEFGIVLFGRPYNAFDSKTNMGISKKFSSKGYNIVPYDMLLGITKEKKHVVDNMFWALGENIMEVAKLVSDRKNLFGVFVTNFSCGPDSFIIQYFRNLMNKKPSLTLEFDQHTADAGIDTRIEAAIDIMKIFFEGKFKKDNNEKIYHPTTMRVIKNKIEIIDSNLKKIAITDKRVEVLIPKMGTRHSEFMAAAFRSIGINAKALSLSDKSSLLLGRKNTTGKECLPYILTTGNFLTYINKRTDENKVLLFLLGTACGPCRFGQYTTAFNQLIKQSKIKNVSNLTINYLKDDILRLFGKNFLITGYKALIVADVFVDLKSMLCATATNPEKAVYILDECWEQVIKVIEKKSEKSIEQILTNFIEKLEQIEIKREPAETPIISLVGEIFVRADEFSKLEIVKYLENHGFAISTAPSREYADYSSYILKKNLDEVNLPTTYKIGVFIGNIVKNKLERKIINIFSKSKFYVNTHINVKENITSIEHLIDRKLLGEAILTVSVAVNEILRKTCGVVSIGPFGCMPSRIAESILKKEMTVDGITKIIGKELNLSKYKEFEKLPFLPIEVDGNNLTPLIISNLESFVLQARRIHEKMIK